MNILKKIWYKITGKKQEEECWYNNAHEKKRPLWTEGPEGIGGGDSLPNDYSVVNRMAKD
ncbi:MAG: hypothetical protein J6M26_04485 [Clostridia bacterium]|nr:hypothetical protein [Clostridia bacterium]